MKRRRAYIPGVDQAERRRRMQTWKRQRERPPPVQVQLDFFRDPDDPIKSPAEARPKEN